MLYDDSYPYLEENISPSNIGAMKKKNIINLLYGIINRVIQGEEKCIDIQIYDVKQCFVSVSISVYQYLHKHTYRDEKDRISYPWQENLFCPDLKVHGTKMGQVNEDTYLGDIVSNYWRILERELARDWELYPKLFPY